ncbi:regulatory YrvL family protein [Halobacillus salinarum]|uniref:Regulatory YrvL family protein n=1 Tax=Halobacillus salinarum TaxID=2932257 RepID=A0ABY4ELA0_9BACI|nr:YrvL family regulatory protein [Halobacillus salinarum]UOQ45180.1 regulatory YrvL family protein [Halobacillus salinarum]
MKQNPGLITILSVVLLILLTAGAIFGGFFFGMVGLFEVIGVSYTSAWSLLLFAILVLLLGFFFEIMAKMVKALSVLAKPSPYVLRIWKPIVDTGFTWLTIYTVDELVKHVSLTAVSEWIFAVLLVVVDYLFDDKKKNQKTSLR